MSDLADDTVMTEAIIGSFVDFHCGDRSAVAITFGWQLFSNLERVGNASTETEAVQFVAEGTAARAVTKR